MLLAKEAHMILATTNLLTKQDVNPSIARQIMSRDHGRVYFKCEFLLPVLGSYTDPLVKGDTVIFWLDRNRPTDSHDDFYVYLSSVRDISHRMNIIWANIIIGDRMNGDPCIQVQNILNIIGDWIPYERNYIDIYESEVFQNTVRVKMAKEGTNMQKWTVLWDYTALSMDTQLKIISTLVMWHSHTAANIMMNRLRGWIQIESCVTDDRIKEFVQAEFLQGKIWFVKGLAVKTRNFRDKVVSKGPQLVDANMLIYTAEEFNEMLGRLDEMEGN